MVLIKCPYSKVYLQSCRFTCCVVRIALVVSVQLQWCRLSSGVGFNCGSVGIVSVYQRKLYRYSRSGVNIAVEVSVQCQLGDTCSTLEATVQCWYSCSCISTAVLISVQLRGFGRVGYSFRHSLVVSVAVVATVYLQCCRYSCSGLGIAVVLWVQQWWCWKSVIIVRYNICVGIAVVISVSCRYYCSVGVVSLSVVVQVSWRWSCSRIDVSER